MCMLCDICAGVNVNEQCCDMTLNSTELGSFRWQLSDCDRKRMFVCETHACNKHHFRCASGHQCVSGKSICDGARDCDDGSDERQCDHGKDLSLFGNLYTASHITMDVSHILLSL